MGLTEPGVNSLQTDMLFAELFGTLAAPVGRVGCIIPTAIATGAGGQFLFGDFSRRGGVASLYDFENRKPLFPASIPATSSACSRWPGRRCASLPLGIAFFLFDVADLDDPGPGVRAQLRKNSRSSTRTRGTLPIFRYRRDAALTAAIYGHVPVLWDEAKTDGNPWGITFKNLFNMTDDSDLFRTREQLEREGWRLHGNVFTRDGKRMLPLYEAKMAHFFNHRAADVVKSETAVNRQNQPRYLTRRSRDPARCAMPLILDRRGRADSHPEERQRCQGSWRLRASCRGEVGAGLAVRLARRYRRDQ